MKADKSSKQKGRAQRPSGTLYIPPHRRNVVSGNENRGHECGEHREAKNGIHEGSQEQVDINILLNAFDRVCCINLSNRRDRWNQLTMRMQRLLGSSFVSKMERFDAVDGQDILKTNSCSRYAASHLLPNLEWNAAKNAKYDRHIQPPMNKKLSPGEVGCILSHLHLWEQLSSSTAHNKSADTNANSMLILEDDVVFYHHRGPTFFIKAFASIWKALPQDWDILYLGLSDRGPRIPVESSSEPQHPKVHLFRPTYGFHTHAYALTQVAARHLLSQIPVTGPLDVWLADNDWFGLRVYCGVLANQGWNRTGRYLATQHRPAQHNKTNIAQSGRV